MSKCHLTAGGRAFRSSNSSASNNMQNNAVAMVAAQYRNAFGFNASGASANDVAQQQQLALATQQQQQQQMMMPRGNDMAMVHYGAGHYGGAMHMPPHYEQQQQQQLPEPIAFSDPFNEKYQADIVVPVQFTGTHDEFANGKVQLMYVPAASDVLQTIRNQLGKNGMVVDPATSKERMIDGTDKMVILQVHQESSHAQGGLHHMSVSMDGISGHVLNASVPDAKAGQGHKIDENPIATILPTGTHAFIGQSNKPLYDITNGDRYLPTFWGAHTAESFREGVHDEGNGNHSVRWNNNPDANPASMVPLQQLIHLIF